MTSEISESFLKNPLPSRPTVVTVIAYLLLLNLGGTAIYLMLFGRYLQQVAIFPSASLAPQLQWQLFEVLNCIDFFIAIALLWGQRWARWGYIITGLFGFVFIFLIYPQTQAVLIVQLLFSAPCFLVFICLLYRKDAQLYFASRRSPRPHISIRRRIGTYLYVFATVFAFWSLNAIVLGITEIYPQTLHRDKFAFFALPMILIAEWIGKTPGVMSRLNNLAIAFSVYLVQMFLYKYASSYTVQIGPSLGQLRNWTIGISSVSIFIFYLQFRRHRQQ